MGFMKVYTNRQGMEGVMHNDAKPNGSKLLGKRLSLLHFAFMNRHYDIDSHHLHS